MSIVVYCQEKSLDFVKIRKDRGFSQKRLAEILGVDRKTLWAWEKGYALPYDDNIKKLADALEVDEEALNAMIKARYYARQLKLLGCSIDDVEFLYEQVA